VTTLQCPPHDASLLNQEMFPVGPPGPLQGRQGFFLPCSVFSFDIAVNLLMVDESWWEPYTSSMLRCFITSNFFCNKSYPYFVKKRLDYFSILIQTRVLSYYTEV